MEESDTGITRLRRIVAQLSGDDGQWFRECLELYQAGARDGSLGAGAPHGGKVRPAPNGTRSFAVLRQSTARECERRMLLGGSSARHASMRQVNTASIES
jgi:hypothetical protein